MSQFYCIYNSQTTDSLNVAARLASLEKACQKYNIQFCLMDEAITDFSNLPVPTEHDGLYNCTRGSFLLEKAMLNNKVRSFYRTYNYLSFQDDSNLINIELEKQNIPVPKTVYKINNDKQLLRQYVDYLGGFPVVIKTYGGTGGIGVIKVDNYPTLLSIVDYFVSETIDFQIKEFIPSDTCERATVVGNEVIGNITRPNKPDDFRSNVFDPKAYSSALCLEVQKIAIQATHAANLNFAGVDIIISKKDNKAYVLEVNCPNNFAIMEQVAGYSYSEKMIKWLFKKS